MDVKLEKVWKQIKEFLTENPQQTVAEISAKCKLNKKTVTDIVTEKYDSGELECSKTLLGVLFSVPKSNEPEVTPTPESTPTSEGRTGEQVTLISPAEKAKLAAQGRRKPYSTTGTTGFKQGAGKITIFLDREISAKSITFNSVQLQMMLEVING